MNFIHFLSRHISYTFAIAFVTIAAGWVLIIAGFVLGSFFTVIPIARLSEYFIKWLPVSIAVPTLLYYVGFGLLTRLKIPAFLRSLRIINVAYDAKFEFHEDDIPVVYGYYSDLPMYNTMAAAFFTILTAMIFIGLFYYEFSVLNIYSILELQALVKVTCLSFVITISLYGMTTYLITERLTNGARTELYNNLLKSGMRIKPRAITGFRVKFLFLVWLTVASLLSFAALFAKVRLLDENTIIVPAVFFAGSVLASLLLMQVTANSILRILKDVSRVTKAIASGKSAEFEVLSTEREFTDIEFALIEMEREIDEYRKDVEGKVAMRTEELQDALSNLRGRDDQIQKQLDMASVIQRSMLPARINDWNELKFAVRYLAMEKIGGDFYDVNILKDDKIGVLIADVSGHGIPAALVTTMAKMSFGNAGSKFDSPKKIFQEVNQSILDHVKTQEYLTGFMLSIDEDYRVVYSNASHQKAMLLRANGGSIELLDTNGLFIGAVEDARDTYEEKHTQLEYGDRVILYTDGIPEAINDRRMEYTTARLEQSIVRNRQLPIEEFADAIINDVRRFVGNAQMVDDVTFLVIELVRDEAVDMIKKSKKLINAHEYQDAIGMLEEGLAIYPGNQKLIYNLAKDYLRVGNFQKAVETSNQYIQNDKMNKNAFYIAGAAYYQLTDYDKAINYFEKALELDTSFVNALFAQGMAYKKKGDSKNAVKSFQRVINIDSDNKMAQFEIKNLAGVR